VHKVGYAPQDQSIKSCCETAIGLPEAIIKYNYGPDQQYPEKWLQDQEQGITILFFHVSARYEVVKIKILMERVKSESI
jgi:hypothetical protein